jgi:MFS family permease
MSLRTASWLAWSLAAFGLAMFVATVALHLLARLVEFPGKWITLGVVSNLLSFVPFLAFPLVGALVASRRPRNPIGWILLADGILWMLGGIFDSYRVYSLARPGSVPFPVVIYALGQWLWVPAVGLFAIYLILLFPDGGLPSRRWRTLAWLSGLVLVLLSVGIVLSPGPLNGLRAVQNPFGLEQYPWVINAFLVVLPLLPLCILASAVSLVLRYRRSGGEVREQIKWIAFAALFVGVLFLVDIGASLLLTSGTAADAEPPWLKLLDQFGFLSYTAVPIAVGFAVLKYRLFDIDVIINRTLVYGLLTALLVLVYFGGVTATQAVFRTLTGQQQQPQLAIVVSTLVIAALFNPLRRRIQSLIDMRFYRRKYDAAKTLEAFSAKLRDETDLDALSDDLVGVARETMQPSHVSLWLRPDMASKKDDVSG